jgi:Tn3 transposase DDE domain
LSREAEGHGPPPAQAKQLANDLLGRVTSPLHARAPLTNPTGLWKLSQRSGRSHGVGPVPLIHLPVLVCERSWRATATRLEQRSAARYARRAPSAPISSYRQRQRRTARRARPVNAIVLYNTIYTQCVLDHRAATGLQIDDVDVERLSPLASDHLTLTGRYRTPRRGSTPPQRLPLAQNPGTAAAA